MRFERLQNTFVVNLMKMMIFSIIFMLTNCLLKYMLQIYCILIYFY